MSDIEFDSIAVLIPAYKPDGSLMLPFLSELMNTFKNVIVVDDGGGQQYKSIFDSCVRSGAKVLTHGINRGKGAALKTGISYIRDSYPEVTGVVTADCDGQHLAADIEKVARALAEEPNKMIIGGRRFDKDVPLRSKAGNTLTRQMFKLATGVKIYDTQTGLRAFGRELFDELISLKGDRYEYEMNMLLKLREWGVEPKEITIKTVYINDNATSHYNPIKDSLKIGSRILLFLSSSIISFVVDYVAMLLLMAFVFPDDSALYAALSFCIARVLSATVNYLLNKNVVFRGKNAKHSVIKYFALAFGVMVLGAGVSGLAEALFESTFIVMLCKAVYDIVMYFVNYVIQRDFIFKSEKKSEK